MLVADQMVMLIVTMFFGHVGHVGDVDCNNVLWTCW